jgi:hypothetical protein
MQREFFDLKDRLVKNRDQPAASADGAQIELLANINTQADARTAQVVGATGVGLFRTEYLFLNHQDVPDEQEQYEYYRQVIEAAPDRTVVIRTLDLGGDKTVPYLGRRNEANPFMGWRSIRLSFEHPRLFERQIRAILRAGRHGKVSMLFPMITTLEELRHVNKLVAESRSNLRREGVPFGEDVKTGVMVEVPAAAGLHRRHPPRDRLHLHRLERPDPVPRGRRPRQREGRPPLRAAEPGDLQGPADGARRLPAHRDARHALRRDGRTAPLRPGAVRDGPETLQHEPRVRADDQGPAQLRHDRTGRTVRPPCPATEDQRRDPGLSDRPAPRDLQRPGSLRRGLIGKGLGSPRE